MISVSKITEIYCLTDDFCKEFEATIREILASECQKKTRKKPSRLSDSEVITIIVFFNCMNFICLKHFYLDKSTIGWFYGFKLHLTDKGE